MLYIGIDLGTSAVKLLLMDEKGNITGYVDTQLNQAIDILTK